MSIDYRDVTEFLEKKGLGLNELAVQIEDEIINARDNVGVPVYLTKRRIKKAPSAYLKTKRKGIVNLNEISDWIGLRILCLFQQDIAAVHRFLLDKFSSKENSAANSLREIKEIIVFNWDLHQAKKEIEEPTANSLHQLHNKVKPDDLSTKKEYKRIYRYRLGGNDKELTFKAINRGSGYKSVHYAIVVGPVKIEIQLRTLLQDVWGELEHALSYKQGKIHPHIRSSFKLLSDELKAKDTLVSQLREIGEKEKAFSHFTITRQPPSRWLPYENSFEASIPKETGFTTFCCDHSRRWKELPIFSRNINDVNEIRIELNAYRRKVENVKCEALEYFFAMENAYIAMYLGDRSTAKEIYTNYVQNGGTFKDRWVVHFRLGELLNQDGEVHDALARFDYCERLLRSNNDCDRIMSAEFFAKKKLANIYWSLGEEYIDLAIKKIKEAEVLFKQLNEEDRKKVSEISLLNNLCYYALEKSIKLSTLGVEDTDRHWVSATGEAFERFEDLRDLVDKSPKGDVSSNIYDTLAWYCFNKSKEGDLTETESLEWLRKSVAYSEETHATSTRNSSPISMRSDELQNEHIREIMAEKSRRLRSD